MLDKFYRKLSENGKMAKYARDTFNGQRGLHFEIDDDIRRML